MTKTHICALGSSFAAGPGILPREYIPAGRSANNYAHLLAKKLDADLTDRTCSGATLLNVLNTPQTTLFVNHFPPQLEGVPENADIVTLTAGGNDVGYGINMMKDSLWASGFGGSNQQGAEASISIEELTQRFLAVVDAIKQKAPKATLYLIDYIPIFGDLTKPGHDTPLSQIQINHFRGMAEQISTAFREAAKARPKTILLTLGEWSQGHEVGSKEPWVDGFQWSLVWSMLRGRGGAPYHPNAAGHIGIAEELFKKINGGGK